MYLIIKRDKSEHLKEKVHKLKKIACEVMDCLEEAYDESRDNERERERERYRERSRDYDRHRYEDDDYNRDMVRGRDNRSGGGRGRY